MPCSLAYPIAAYQQEDQWVPEPLSGQLVPGYITNAIWQVLLLV